MAHIHERIIEEQDQALFDRIAQKYAQKDIVRSSSLPRQYQLMFAVEPVLKKSSRLNTIIEIACGLGASSKYLEGYYARYIGVDYSARLIAKARDMYGANKRAEFIRANIKDTTACPIGPHGADLILAVGALHHMTELDRVIKALIYIAKPGAYFIAVEPNRANPLIQALRWLWARVNPAYSKDQKFFSKKELYEILAKHNFQNIELEFQGFFTPPFAQVIVNPQVISVALSKLAILIDKILDACLPGAFKFLSWNIVVRAKFRT